MKKYKKYKKYKDKKINQNLILTAQNFLLLDYNNGVPSLL